MKFSIFQWFLWFVLDFLLKSGLLYLMGGFFLVTEPFSSFMSFGLGLAMFHFFSLWLANGFVGLFNLTRAVRIGCALAVANILFAGCIVLLLVLPMWGRPCSLSEVSCDWGNRRITASGVLEIAVMALVLLVFNLIPFSIAAAFGAFARRIKQSLQKSPTKTIVGG